MKSLDKSKAVVLFSGGLDSTCALFIATKSLKEVHALSIHYGQRHAREINSASDVADNLGVEHTILDLSRLQFVLAGSALTSPLCEVPEGHYEDASMKVTVVPNRNMILLAIAGGYAISRGLGRVVLANHAGDHVIYPDCRPDFISAMRSAFRVCHYEQLEIDSPFICTTKGELLLQALELGIDPKMLYDSWSCYKGGEMHCGQCGTCVERKEAFFEADVEDRTEYQE